uniref:LIM zinc-binding domain-containing protein n=1 Tax=Culex tarsalis TaxID=7177 RepID=A0A1Q3FY86_CULTA
MPMDQEETSPASSKTKDVMYSISNYEDTRNTSNKPVSHDPADYIQKARVTKAVPPKPAYDPLQFVQLKPCSLVKTAQEQIKKAETVKKVQEEKKEEPEEWQCNLDSWKSSRRKRVEHIIDRVVEVKKLELEEHDRNRRKSKTFNEMMEQRGSRRKYLPIYTDEDNNDLTEFGLGSCDKNETSNENDAETTANNNNENNNSIIASQANTTEYNEYTEAIEGYKSRVSRAGHLNSSSKTESCSIDNTSAVSIKKDNVKTEENIKSCEQQPSIVPKIDFLKRKELFEKEQCVTNSGGEQKRQSADIISTVSIKERLSILQLGQSQEVQNEVDRNPLPIPDASFSDLKNRLEVFEREIRCMGNDKQSSAKISLNVSTECSTNNTNAESCGIPSNETYKNTQHQLSGTSSFDNSEYCIFTQKQSSETHDNDNLDTDREDSGIHTTDVSCSVSQADDQNEEVEQDDEANQKLQLTSNQNLESLPTCKPNDYDPSDVEEIYNDRILDDALEMAFQEIDTMDVAPTQANFPQESSSPSQNVSSGETNSEQIEKNMIAEDFEPYYQVPKSQEPYYEVPKTKSIPLYENVDIVRAAAMRSSEAVDLTIAGCTNQQPPKEKPPPPPVEMIPDERVDNADNFKRINSTKRIKNEIRNSRTSFLGIESQDENDGQLSFAHLLKSNAHDQHHNRNEQNYLSKARSYSDVGAIRDSSVIQNHPPHSSDLCNSMYGGSQDMITPNQSGDQRFFTFNQYSENNKDNPLQRSITEGTNRWLIDNEFLKQENVQNMSNYVETPHDMEQVKERNPIPPPIPPAKPLRSQQYNLNSEPRKCLSNMPNLEFDQFQSFSDKQAIYNNIVNNNPPLTAACHPLREQSRFCKSSHALNNTPEIPIGGQNPKTPNERALLYNTNEFGSDPFPHMLRQRSQTECSPQWNVQPSRKPSGSNNRHWLIQEAEQRRIEQQANIYHSTAGFSQNTPRKSLPDSVIQTITQRVQTLGIGTDRRWSFENHNNINRLHTNEANMNPSSAQSINQNESEDKILSVSGKKKCSHCNNELGRGAAMVIESLGLLYHLKCFKCFVCHTRLGDGFNGTDVRVRKYKLHCQNCFSSEDGVKFSCV